MRRVRKPAAAAVEVHNNKNKEKDERMEGKRGVEVTHE